MNEKLPDLNICEVVHLHFESDTNEYLKVGWVLLETAVTEGGHFQFLVGYPDRHQGRGRAEFDVRRPPRDRLVGAKYDVVEEKATQTSTAARP